MTERVLIVGTGLIGGSIGLALRRSPGMTVTGYDAVASTANAAHESGALDEVAEDLAAGVRGARLVVIATPVGEVLPTVTQLASCADDGAVITDVGSTKATIVSEAERLLGPRRSFVGGHPMAGTEGEGISSARADLFEEALWILTPTDRTDSDAYRRVNTLVTTLGAHTLALEPSEHDRLVALVSHVPYAISTTLMAVAGREGDPRVFRAAAGSFRDITRTAGSNPRIWRDIFATNREAVLRELDQFADSLARFREAIEQCELNVLDELVEEARDARKRFPAKGERAPAEPVVLEIAIPDRAGVLAEITTALGEGTINIEDLWVDHTSAGGVLRVLVDGARTAAEGARLLRAKAFPTTIVVQQ